MVADRGGRSLRSSTSARACVATAAMPLPCLRISCPSCALPLQLALACSITVWCLVSTTCYGDLNKQNPPGLQSKGYISGWREPALCGYGGQSMASDAVSEALRV